jgi:4-hydroxybenzoate polyprenyltransferase
MDKKTIYNFALKTLHTTFSIKIIILTFLALILARLGIENWISHFETHNPVFYFYEFLHTFLFFYLLFIICIALSVKIAKISLKSSITLFLFGFIFILFPPIIDWFISTIYFNGANFMSYYLFDSLNGLLHSFFTFFGDKPMDGITYGTRIMILISIMFLSLLTFLKTKQFFRTIFMAIFSYTIFFLLSAIPTFITIIISNNHLSITRTTVASIIASPTSILGNQITSPISSINIKMSLLYLLLSILVTLFIIFRLKKHLFISLLINIRPIQTIYHIGLLFIGIGIAIIFTKTTILPSFFTFTAFILLCLATIMAWYSTVIFNDCIDQDIDKISNTQRPLIQKILTQSQYTQIGILLMLLSIIIVATINPYAALVLIFYHSLSFLYNTPPLRLKRFPLIATFTAAIASFLIVAMSFITVTKTHSINEFPVHIAVLLIVTYTISLPIKDLKDIAGDKANDIFTIPVIFGERISRSIIATSIFLSFMLSIFTLGTKSILIPAILSGALCFWTLVGQKNNKFIFTTTQVLPIVFVIVTLYAIILFVSLLH